MIQFEHVFYQNELCIAPADKLRIKTLFSRPNDVDWRNEKVIITSYAHRNIYTSNQLVMSANNPT